MNHAVLESLFPPLRPFDSSAPLRRDGFFADGERPEASLDVRFVPDGERFALLTEVERAAILPVNVPPPSARDRGHLALVIEEAIEVALERRGASPPGVTSEGDLEASLSDQLYRARLVELRGLALFMGALEALGDAEGALDAEDSRTLRFWLESPPARPVRVYLDPADQTLGVYPAPVPLERLLAPEPRAGEASEESDAVVEALAELPSPTPTGRPAPSLALGSPTGKDAPVPVGEIAHALLNALGGTQPDEEPGPTEPEAPLGGQEPEAPGAPTAAVNEHGDAAIAAASAAGDDFREAETAGDPAEEPLAEPPPRSERRPIELGPLGEDAEQKWPVWLRDLEGARGPKPLAAVERMFAKSYVPLRDAYLRGIAPADTAKVLDGWAESFAQSYSETFAALRLRSKRPLMIHDLPEFAQRIARVHGAKSVQFLLIDGLRYDLGLRVERLLRERLGHELALAERLLHWAALPSDTACALELFGRGAEALADFDRGPDSVIPQARGRLARVPRRIKAGHRELLKLDLVEAELDGVGGPEPERLDTLALRVADALAELIEKLPTRTLLLAFGDHGFVLDWRPEGTTPAHHGGARPEEVLVPAYAWLVGGVQ